MRQLHAPDPHLREYRAQRGLLCDAAVVPPKIDSVPMGHAIPSARLEQPQVTPARYTHALPQDIERARAKLAAYLADAQQVEAAGQ